MNSHVCSHCYIPVNGSGTDVIPHPPVLWPSVYARMYSSKTTHMYVIPHSEVFL